MSSNQAELVSTPVPSALTKKLHDNSSHYVFNDFKLRFEEGCVHQTGFTSERISTSGSVVVRNFAKKK
jgi:hypothetical protein